MKLDDINSYHEPEPKMNGKPMFEFLKGNDSLMKLMMKQKINAILHLKNNSPLYVETNHTFIKGFGWLLSSMIPPEEMGIVFIKREKNKIINSYNRIKCTPLTRCGRDWFITPLMKKPINKLPVYNKIKYRVLYFIVRFINSKYNKNTFNLKVPSFTRGYDIKLLDWYIKETYDQGEKFRREFPKIKMYDTSIDKLNNLEEYHKMFDFFGLQFKPNDTFLASLGKKANR